MDLKILNLKFENGTLLGVSWLLVSTFEVLIKVLPVLQRFHFLFRERAEFSCDTSLMMAVNFNPIFVPVWTQTTHGRLLLAGQRSRGLSSAAFALCAAPLLDARIATQRLHTDIALATVSLMTGLGRAAAYSSVTLLLGRTPL